MFKNISTILRSNPLVVIKKIICDKGFTKSPSFCMQLLIMKFFVNTVPNIDRFRFDAICSIAFCSDSRDFILFVCKTSSFSCIHCNQTIF